MHGWYESRHHSCETTKAGLRMVLLRFSKYAPRRIGFIPQWLLCEQLRLVRWIHPTRDAVSSFVATW